MKELFGKLDTYMASYVEQNTNRLFRGKAMTYKTSHANKGGLRAAFALQNKHGQISRMQVLDSLGHTVLGARRVQRMHTYSQNSHAWPLDHGWQMWPTA